MTPTETDWRIRHFIYADWLRSGGAPKASAIAAEFGLSRRDAGGALKRLHEAHALVLEADGGEILMANPLSAVPTDYCVTFDGLSLYANCAWDSLGIPAMLGGDARIEARHPLDGEVMPYAIVGGELQGSGLVHFARAFRHWYDDIVDT